MSEFESAADETAFDAAVGGGDMVIAKFQTRACVICRRLEPGLVQLSERMAEDLRIIDVDAEDVPELAQRYNIQGVPTLILFREGRELTRCNGFQSTGMLRDWLAPHLGG